MHNSSNASPIGVYDSGLGGLTVAKYIARLLPNESLVYYGDTLHLPYGDKSKKAIISYSEEIISILKKEGCKAIVIACHSAASVLDLGLLSKKYNIKIYDVITPTIEYIKKNCKNKLLGLIGTNRTINSGIYPALLKGSEILDLMTLATPLFAPMIDDGFVNDQISDAIILHYLKNEKLRDIDAIILGCTHYNMIKNQIHNYYNSEIDIIDPSFLTAEYIKKSLLADNLRSDAIDSRHKFYVSDMTENFPKIATIFFGKDIDISQYNKNL